MWVTLGAPVSVSDKPAPVSVTSSNSYHGNGVRVEGIASVCSMYVCISVRVTVEEDRMDITVPTIEVRTTNVSTTTIKMVDLEEMEVDIGTVVGMGTGLTVVEWEVRTDKVGVEQGGEVCHGGCGHITLSRYNCWVWCSII